MRTAILLLSGCLLALSGCKGSCITDVPGGSDQVCVDDMQKQVCTNMAHASFDSQPCAARGFQKRPDGVWVKSK